MLKLAYFQLLLIIHSKTGAWNFNFSKNHASLQEWVPREVEKKSFAIWHQCHTILSVMKMTMHIDESVLADVMKITGVESKTKAVEKALTEMVRKHRFKTLAMAGSGMTSEELRKCWEDPFAENEGMLRVAEDSPRYGSGK